MFKYIIILILLSLQPLRNMNMLVTIESSLDLPEVSSGSGLAIVEDDIFIVGDDSPYLYQLNTQYVLSKKHLLIEGMPTEGRIPKAIKADLECMAEEKTVHGTNLYMFGSGSKSPERDYLLVYNPKEANSLRKYVLSSFYERIIQQGGIQRAQFNLEASVILGNTLYLFNRGHNQIIIIPLIQFKNYLENKASASTKLLEMEIEVRPIELPRVDGVQSRFSGACMLPGTSKILFSATLEETDNWIDDGEIHGSMLGIIDAGDPNPLLPQHMSLIMDSKGDKALEKIESISFTAYDPQGHLHLLAVADNDDGSSRLFSLRVDKNFIESGS